MNKKAFLKALKENGLYFDHHGSRHDIYIHKTGKKVPIPRHNEFSNEFLKVILKEIPKESGD
ncbi:MAG: type II toxin-antitoxin system HicA family toxin [Treponema sp.]|nr:type II toxin-antitoxin system HicA family toxin [Treponema sp.]